MKVAFLTNHISFGGTEVALYDYAHFNETLLGNKSIIITRDFRQTHKEIYDKFQSRFPVFFIKNQNEIDNIVLSEKCDILYVQKSGQVDWYVTNKCKNIVHCVFTTQYPHGTIYCSISETLNKFCNTNVPVLPYMVYLNSHDESYKQELNIDSNVTVIGRYGSFDSFDIPFVYSAIKAALDNDPNLIFLMMNTKVFFEHPRLIYLPRTTDLYVKRKFINTCDVMLHARTRGETFGLSCGEFAISGKPIITYGLSPENAHIDILEDKCLIYNDEKSLLNIIKEKKWSNIDMSSNGYMKYTPEHVMKIFDRMIHI